MEEYGYSLLIEISPYPTLLKLTYFLAGIHHCVTVVDEWIFGSTFTFAILLTKDDLEYCLTNENETELMNGYHVVLKSIVFLTKDNNKIVLWQW